MSSESSDQILENPVRLLEAPALSRGCRSEHASCTALTYSHVIHTHTLRGYDGCSVRLRVCVLDGNKDISESPELKILFL